jgi:hypothetical protein
MKSAQNVLEGEVQGMPHVQGSGDIGRWDNDGIWFAWTISLGTKTTDILPERNPPLFHGGRFISLGQGNFSHENNSNSFVILPSDRA